MCVCVYVRVCVWQGRGHYVGACGIDFKKLLKGEVKEDIKIVFHLSSRHRRKNIKLSLSFCVHCV